MRLPSPFGRRWLFARIAVYVLVLGVLGLGLWRFDLVRLPADGCSPLHGLAPGDRVVVDRWTSGVARGEIVLYRSPEDELLLGRVSEPPASAPDDVEACRAGALWLVVEDRACSTKDSAVFGPVPRARLVGRIRAVLPW